MYVADLLVGTVVNVALVSMLAPYVRIGQLNLSKGLLGRLQHTYGALPSRLQVFTKNLGGQSFKYCWKIFSFLKVILLCSVFEAERPGCRFSLQQRMGTYFYKVRIFFSLMIL